MSRRLFSTSHGSKLGFGQDSTGNVNSLEKDTNKVRVDPSSLCFLSLREDNSATCIVLVILIPFKVTKAHFSKDLKTLLADPPALTCDSRALFKSGFPATLLRFPS